MPGAIDATLRKFHTSLNVTALDRSIAFYRVLLGVEPAKVRGDYAKFELADPPLVLSLIPGQPRQGGHLNHAGLRVRTAEELVEIQRRLEAAGMPTQREDGVECCYAKQTKFWVSDPDGALWEIYVFHEDVDDDEHDHHAGTAAPMRVQPPAAVTAPIWEHRLRDEIPPRIPHDDNWLQEVRLEGSFNLPPDAPHRDTLLAEAHRALRPGATVSFHGLAGDRTCAGPVSLSGPASAVKYAPSVAEVSQALAAAGFVDITVAKLSQTAYFVVNGVPLREVRISGRKPGYRPAAASYRAVYLGPMREVTDDLGNVFQRGVATPVNVHDWQVIANGAAKSSFLLLKPEESPADGCCAEPAATPVTLVGRRDA